MPLDTKQYLAPLKELSHIDHRLQWLKKELAQIPTRLETSGAEYLTLARAMSEKETALEGNNKERASLELDLKTLSEEALAREKRLFAIKTQKEYQATLKEIAKIKQENRQREERVLSLMEEAEKVQKEITQLKSEIADKEGDYKKIEMELTQSQQSLAKEVEELQARRPKLLAGVAPEILKKYDLVKRRFEDPIAGVKKGICLGCNMNIPPQIYNEMLKHSDLRHCPNCHRLVYVELDLQNGT